MFYLLPIANCRTKDLLQDSSSSYRVSEILLQASGTGASCSKELSHLLFSTKGEISELSYLYHAANYHTQVLQYVGL